jgi:hypothetical protein
MRQHIDTTPHPPQPLPTLEKRRRTSCRIASASRKIADTPTRELPYKEISTINPTEARKRIVQTYYQTGN